MENHIFATSVKMFTSHLRWEFCIIGNIGTILKNFENLLTLEAKIIIIDTKINLRIHEK